MARGEAARRRLIAEAKAAERRAGKKVSRIEAHGVNVAHSEHDPRVGARNVEKYDAKQLRGHIRKLNGFIDRKTQFVGGFAGAPLRRDRVERYKQLEAFNNEKAQGYDMGLSDVKLPGQSGTVGGRAERNKQREAAKNQGRIFQMIDRPLYTITGGAELERLIGFFEKKTKRGYVRETIDKRMNSGNAILKYSGNEDLIDEIAKLSQAEKRMLIDDSQFFNIALEQFDSPDKSEVTQVRDVAYEEHEGIPKNIHVREAMENELRWVKENAPRGNRTATVDNAADAAGKRRVGDRGRRGTSDTRGPRR